MKKIVLIFLCACLLCGCAQADMSAYPSWTEDAFVIPDGITLIEKEAFRGDTSLTYVVLPESVSEVGANAFAGCTSLERICVLNAKATLSLSSLGTTSEVKEIWGYAGSTAESYAKSAGYTFVRIYPFGMDKLLDYAATKIDGTEYKQGSWDCVLFVRHCYLKQFGVTLPATCQEMYQLDTHKLTSSQHLQVTRIDDPADLQPGDIICWTDGVPKNATEEQKTEYKETAKCTHVGIYVGDGTITVKETNDPPYEGKVLKTINYSQGVFIDNSATYKNVRYNFMAFSGTNYYYRNFLCGWRVRQ